MDTNINSSDQTENGNHNPKNEFQVRSNLFQGRLESESGSAKFPEWDILPPNQFINPRIKSL